MNLKDMLPNIFGGGSKKRKMKVGDAFDYLVQEEEGRLIDMDSVNRAAVERVESSGIVFLDEIDKIAGREGGHGPDVSPRRRAARHSAHRRRNHGEHALRHGAHRSHSLHRRGRIPCLQAQRSDSRIAGSLPDSRRTASRLPSKTSCAFSPSPRPRSPSSTRRCLKPKAFVSSLRPKPCARWRSLHSR